MCLNPIFIGSESGRISSGRIWKLGNIFPDNRISSYFFLFSGRISGFLELPDQDRLYDFSELPDPDQISDPVTLKTGAPGIMHIPNSDDYFLLYLLVNL